MKIIKTTVLFFLVVALIGSASAATPLNYWVEPDTAYTWIQIPSIEDSISIRVSPGSTNQSGDATFDSFDDFNDGVTLPVTSSLSNAEIYQTIPTYDGSGQCVHPDVLYFADGWAGYKYWMAMTPYPTSNDRLENPSIVVSNDGETWVVPDGIINPIVAAPPEGNGYNADPDIVYNDDTDEMWLYYSSFNGSVITCSVIKINASMGISDPIGLFVSPDVTDLRQRSMAVIKDNDDWHMWVQNTSATQKVQYRSSSDGTNWSSSYDVAFDVPYVPDFWHLNVEQIENKYVMIISTTTSAGDIYLATADSNSPLTFSLYQIPLIVRSVSGWDNQSLYRASTVYNPSSDVLSIWYSAYSIAGSPIWHIGKIDTDYSNLISDLTNESESSGFYYTHGTPSLTTSDGSLHITGANSGIRSAVMYNGSYMFRGNFALPASAGSVGFSSSFSSPSLLVYQTFLKRHSTIPYLYSVVGNGVASANVNSATIPDYNSHILEIKRTDAAVEFSVDGVVFENSLYANNDKKFIWLYSGSATSSVVADWYLVTENPNSISYSVTPSETEYTINVVNSGSDILTNIAIPITSSDIGITSQSDTRTIECVEIDFIASSTSGNVPTTISFNTSNLATRYSWDFENDGIIDSTKQNPVHTYGKAGNYTVNLTVQNEYGNLSTVKTDYITVTAPAFASNPTAWFQWVWSYLSSMFCGMWLSV